MQYSIDDTIVAIATSIGQSGIGVIKLSGPEAYPIVWRLFRPVNSLSELQPHRLHYGYLVDPASQKAVDEVMVVYMPRPHSYTRQDVVEIQAHGGIAPLQQILKLTLELGARPAEAGEMTLRAFLNGRIDLAQAEAVLDVIEAKTEAALRVATEQLSGSLSERVAGTRAALMDVLAFLEASIDFVEDEIPFRDVIPPLNEAVRRLEELLEGAERGLIYRQGVRVAIVGRPNVGKSSLLNALLRGNRAIVTDIPGTTRDTLEETINIGGIPLVLVDTAGIRAAPLDAVEQIGVERSRAALERADAALLMVDGSHPLQPEDWEIERLIGPKPVLLVVNKEDLPPVLGTEALAEFLPGAERVYLSAQTGAGIDRLEEALTGLILSGRVTTADTPLVSNPRHQALLQQALSHTQAAVTAQQAGISPDLVSIDVREAVEALGQITGETVTDDLLETIFSNFCIGK